MKRSEINKALKELEAMCARYRFALPPFCHFTPEQWQTLPAACCATSTRQQNEV